MDYNFSIVSYIFIVLELLLQSTDATVRCLECTDIPSPQDCSVTTTCPSFDLCYVEMVVTSGGLTLYNSGCMSAQTCVANIGKRDKQLNTTEHHSKNYRLPVNRRSTDITLCQECCHGEYCNDQGCGKQASKQPDRGPVCFACPAQSNPDSCRDIVTCDLSQICIISDASSDLPGVLTTGCATQQQCSVLNSQMAISGTSAGNACLKCCSNDYCNDNCHQNITLVTSTSIHDKSTLPLTPSKHTTQTTFAKSTTQQHFTTLTTLNKITTSVINTQKSTEHTTTVKTTVPSTEKLTHTYKSTIPSIKLSTTVKTTIPLTKLTTTVKTSVIPSTKLVTTVKTSIHSSNQTTLFETMIPSTKHVTIQTTKQTTHIQTHKPGSTHAADKSNNCITFYV